MSKRTDRPRILIVDDVPRNIQLAGSALKKHDYNIAIAYSAAEAKERLHQKPIDLILLDIMMPGQDGISLCRSIRLHPEYADIPIIFLTALSDMNSVIQGFDCGAQDYITKPFKQKELIRRVWLHLELRQKRKELEDVNKNLEKIVDERTRELEKANRELKKLDQAKNDFIGLISHEIRTPLTGIIGFADLLDKMLTSSHHLRYLKILRKSAARLEKFVETALLITSIKTDRYELVKKPLLLRMMLDEAVELFHEISKNRNIHVAINVEPDDLLIVGDHELLRMCFNIILENALKFSPKDDYVQIEAGKKGDELRITIIDRGPGIPAGIKDQLFELFVTDDVMHHKEGLCLGLPTAKMIMELHGGRIEVDQNAQGGTVIRLFFEQLY